MSTPRVRPVLLALLGIVAIAVAAATLNSAVVMDGEFGFGSGDRPGPGSDEPAGPNVTEPSPGPIGGGVSLSPISLPCFPFLADPQFLLGAAVVAAGIGYLLYRRAGPLLPIGLAVALAPPAVLLHVLLTSCIAATDPDQLSLPGGFVGNDTFGSGGNGSIGGGGAINAPSLLLLGVLGVALVAAVALLFATSDDRRLDASDGEESPARPPPEAIARAAGRAADRIEEDADLDNEVFRAWHEMTTYLDVPNPESSSPGEFADAAVDAGMDRDDVTHLTRVFEDVRYGAAEPTDERERRAVAALRRIEATYAEKRT